MLISILGQDQMELLETNVSSLDIDKEITQQQKEWESEKITKIRFSRELRLEEPLRLPYYLIPLFGAFPLAKIDLNSITPSNIFFSDKEREMIILNLRLLVLGHVAKVFLGKH